MSNILYLNTECSFYIILDECTTKSPVLDEVVKEPGVIENDGKCEKIVYFNCIVHIEYPLKFILIIGATKSLSTVVEPLKGVENHSFLKKDGEREKIKNHKLCIEYLYKSILFIGSTKSLSPLLQRKLDDIFLKNFGK